MKIRLATLDDLNQLIGLRIDFLRDEVKLSANDEEKVRKQLERYFSEKIGNNDFIACLVEIDDKVVSTAFLAIQQKPASPSFISGFSGTLLNVFTYPEYRKKGYAAKAVKLIIAEAIRRGVSAIELNATSDGFNIYRKLGFVESNYTAMRLKLE